MKLLFQSDDYGITEAVSKGILSGIEDGIIRNTGLFVNMPFSKQAADLIKHKQGVSVGIDINLVAGHCIAPIEKVRHIVDENGNFYSSGVVMQSCHPIKQERIITTIFEKEPYPYEETYCEMCAQVDRFIEWMGRKPSYIHPHSVVSASSYQVMKDVAKKYGLRLSLDFLAEKGFVMVKNDWNPKPFSLQEQADVNVEEHLLSALEEVKCETYVVNICHCGFVDRELFQVSTYTLVRMQDLYAAKSDKIKSFLKEMNVELICYDDIKDV